MPIKKTTYKPLYKKNLKKKPSLKFFVSLIGLTLLLIALPVAYILVKQNQDVRQQAAVYVCAEEDVNTQFRMFEAGTDKPWIDGDKMKVKVGDKIDVNCFAKTGTALLSNGKIALKIDGSPVTIPTASVINDGKSLKAYEITKGGKHTFTCSNKASCSDTDSVNVPKTDACNTDADCEDGKICYQPPMPECPEGMGCAQVMPPKICKNKGTDSCPDPSVADINKDCVVDLKDYDLFLSEFIKSL